MNKSIILFTAVWIFYLGILLPFYLWKENKDGPEGAVVRKLLLSGVFCMLGLFAVIKQNGSVLSVLLLCGFVFSFVGDYFLAFIHISEDRFLKGIGFFGAAQLSYITAMVWLEGVHLGEFIISSLIAVSVLLVVHRYKEKIKLGKIEKALMIYIFLVTFMAVKAVLMLLSKEENMTLQCMFSTGAVFFILSDICLGIRNFLCPRKIFAYLVAIGYFLAQLMIATAVFFQ